MDPAKKFVTFLQSITPVTEEDCEPLLKSMVQRTIPKGAFYLKAGETTDRFGFVTSGLFRFFYTDKDGRDYTSWFAPEQSFIPSYTIVATKSISRFFVEALEDSKALEFPFSVFESLEETSAAARFITKQLLMKAMMDKQIREASLILDDATTRYEAFRRDYAHVENRLKLHHIASYLGISSVSLSRIRKKINTC